MAALRNSTSSSAHSVTTDMCSCNGFIGDLPNRLERGLLIIGSSVTGWGEYRGVPKKCHIKSREKLVEDKFASTRGEQERWGERFTWRSSHRRRGEWSR